MKKLFAFLLAMLCVLSLVACDMSGAITYDLENADRARCFNNTYKSLVEKYGEAKFENGKLTGVAVTRLIDFTGDGIYEFYVAYADGTKDYVNKQMVVGFDLGSATLIGKDGRNASQDETPYENITSKASADAQTPCVWLFKDAANRGYIVTGDDLSKSADYITYISTRGNEKVYSFQVDFTEIDGSEPQGEFEKINLVGITESEAKAVLAENEKVMDSIRAQDK